MENGKPTYRSILIATKDGPVSLSTTSAASPLPSVTRPRPSSHLAPRVDLAKKGLIGGEDYKVVHLGKHDAVARAVAAGQVPAGALSEQIYDVLVERARSTSKMTVLGYSDPLPNYR